MTKMLPTVARTGLILASAIWCLQFEPALSAEPIVEINPRTSWSTSGGDTSVFSPPQVPLTFDVFTRGGYDTNFRTSQSAQSSWFVDSGGTLLYDLPSLTTHLTLRAGGDVAYYLSDAGGQREDVNAYLNGSLFRSVSERLKLEAAVDVGYRTEPDLGSNVGMDTRIGDFFHTLDRLKVNYNWTERFASATSDTLQVVHYVDNSTDATSQNRFQNTVGQELRYDVLHAGNTAVLEYRFEIVDYQTAPRDSTTHFGLIGLDQDFTPYLKLVARGGVTFREYNSQTSRTDPYFESFLTYLGAHHSSLSLRASYGIEEPSTSNVLARTTFRIGLQYTYDLTDRITASIATYYHHDDNTGSITNASSTGGSVPPPSNFTEDVFDISPNLRYQMSRRFSIEVGGEYSEVSSQLQGGDYTRLRSYAGLRVTF